MRRGQRRPAPSYMPLATFASHEWIEIFTNSLSRFQAIRHQNTIPGTRSSLHYHHHTLLLESITDLMECRRSVGFHTALHKVRAHTNIRGNDLAGAAAKRAVQNLDTLPPAQANRVDIGGVATRPTHLVMYTVKPPRNPTQPSLSAPIAPLSTVPSGPSRKRTACKRTPSRARPHNSGARSDMRYYVAYITPLSTGASVSPTKRMISAL